MRLRLRRLLLLVALGALLAYILRQGSYSFHRARDFTSGASFWQASAEWPRFELVLSGNAAGWVSLTWAARLGR